MGSSFCGGFLFVFSNSGEVINCPERFFKKKKIYK